MYSGTKLSEGRTFAAYDDAGIKGIAERSTVYRIKGVSPGAAIVTEDDEIGIGEPLPTST